MNKLISVLFVSIILAVSFSCCKKKTTTTPKKDLIVVDIDRSDTTSLPFAIAPGAPIDLVNTPFQIDTFATKVDEYITPYGFTKAQITKVNLKSLSIVLENSPGQTFNFLDSVGTSIKIYVDSFSGTTPLEVASKTNVPRNITNLTLTVNSADIKDYFRSQYMKLLVGFRTQDNEGVTASTKFRVNYTFTVTADPNL